MLKPDFRRKVSEVIKKDFPDLKKPLIFFVERDDFFMATFKIPFFNVLLVEREALQMNDQAITGCLVHELCHMVWNYHERLTDQMVIAKGYGKELYEFLKYHDSIYKKYNKKDGLTKREVWKQIKQPK